MSTHPLAHIICPVGQLQKPPTQAWVAGHATPPRPAQPPQLPGSVSTSVQVPPQRTAPAPHAHVPALHVAPLGQVPVAQRPPQPSSAPHALPAQLGVQPHIALHWHVPDTHC
jgi:hypothetical protein